MRIQGVRKIGIKKNLERGEGEDTLSALADETLNLTTRTILIIKIRDKYVFHPCTFMRK